MKNESQNHSQCEWQSLFKDETKILDIRYDPVFKAVFTKDTEKSRFALSDLISSFIGRMVEVETIIANEPPVDDIRQRYLRFDVVCKAVNGELINVEMSFNPKFYEPERFEYHAARLFTGQDLHGKDKDFNDLKECYQITILAKKIFFPDKYLTHNFLYYDPDTRVFLGGKTRIITVELEKTKPIVDKPVEKMTNAELWAVFFQYLTDGAKKDKIIEIINYEEGIAMAVNNLATFTQSEIDYFRETSQLIAKLDWNSGLAHARNEGRDEASFEIARKMKNRGRSFSEIAEDTGLSMEIIANL